MLHAVLKIYGVLQRTRPQDGIDIGLQLDLQMILKDLDLPDDKLQIIALERVLVQNVGKDIHRCAGGTVDLNDGIALVRQHINLVANALDLLLQLGLKFIIGLFQQLFLIGVLHQVADALALGRL